MSTPPNKGNPTNFGWRERDIFFSNHASHIRSRFSKKCVLKGLYNQSVSCVTCGVLGTQGYKMNLKRLSLARRLRFILLEPLSTFYMTRIPVLFFACGYSGTIKFMTNFSNSSLTIPPFSFAPNVTGHERTSSHSSCPFTCGMWSIRSY